MKKNGFLVYAALAWIPPSALAGTVSFIGPSDVLPGTRGVQFAVIVDSSDLQSFDTISMTIGSPDGLGLSFEYDPAFVATTTPLTTVPGPSGIYGAVVPGATDVGFSAFRGPGPLWTAPILVGTLTVDTSSILNARDWAHIGIDNAFEVANLGSAVSLVSHGLSQDPLNGLVVNPVPEPAAMGLLALGGLVAALRRRKE